LLEDRITPDAGDTLQHALNTHLGPDVGMYAMPSEHLGDGNFGALDVDLYTFKARAGEVLTATTAPALGGTSVNTFLQLFDADGHQLASNGDSDPSPSSRIGNYVFTAAGTYYLGVSGAPNFSYNPTWGGTGTAGGTGDYRLTVKLFIPTADAAGDTIATAQATGLSTTPGTFAVTAAIGDGLYLNNDVDLYRIDVNAGQVLTAVTSLPPDGAPINGYPTLEVFDATGAAVVTNDYWNAANSATNITYQFSAAGTYYVGVSGYPYYDPNVAGSAYAAGTGDYQLNLTLITPTTDAAGDTIATAQATNLGPAAGTFSATAQIGDGLYRNNDVDLYRIDVNAGQVVTALTSLPAGGTSMATELRLFDATGHELLSNFYSSNYPYSRLQYQFASAGTYYVGVSGAYNLYYDPTTGGSGNPGSLGDYHLDLTLLTPTADAAGDTIATAQATNLGPAPGTFNAIATIGDGLYPLGDVDLYRVDVNAGQVLTAVTSLPAGGTPLNATVLKLFDPAGNPLWVALYGGNSSERLDYVFTTGGTYYLGVSGQQSYNPNHGGSGISEATGDYQLNLTLVTPTADTAGDTIATAQATNLGPTAGTFNATATIGDGLYPLKDVDLYRVDVAAGQVLTAATAQPGYLRLFDAAGRPLAGVVNSGSGANTPLEYQFATAGAYYVGVSGYSYFTFDYNPTVGGSAGIGATRGDYQLTLTLAVPTADSAGDTLATAQATGMGPGNGTFAVNSHIGDGLHPLQDVDLYQFQATAGQGLIATTSQVSGGTPMNTALRLFDSTGHPLANENLLRDFGANLPIRYIFSTTGTYYVGVSGYGITVAGYTPYGNLFYDPTTPVTGGAPLGARGDYHLDLSLVTPVLDSAGDTLATAQDTGFGPGDGTATLASNAHLGDGFYGDRDVDLYRFAGTAGQRLTATTSTPAGGTPLSYPVLWLFDSTGHRLTYGYEPGNSSIRSFLLPATGTYYLGLTTYPNFFYDPTVAGSNNLSYPGDYRLDATLLTPTPDAEGDTLATALATGLGPTAGTYGHTARIGDGLNLLNDVDLYRIDVVAGQVLRAGTALPAGGQGMDTILEVFNAAGSQLIYNDDSSGGLYSFLQYQFTTTGTYYVGVSGYANFSYNPTVAGSGPANQSTGDYHLDLTLLTLTPDAEGDTLATAVATGLGTTPGTYGHTAHIGDGLNYLNDVDLYRIDVNAGQFLRAATTQPAGGTYLSTGLRLFDATGHELALSYYGANTAIEYRFTTAGTYYVGVSSYANLSYNPTVAGSGPANQATGDYQLDLTLTTPTPDAEGETLAAAVATGMGPAAGSYSHTARVGDGLYLSKDVDLYRLDAVAGQVVTAMASVPNGGTPVDTYLRLFDASGTELAANYDALEYRVTAAGTYYLGVSGAGDYDYAPTVGGSGSSPSYGAGDYHLDLSLFTPTPDAVGDTIATALNTRVGPNPGTFTMASTRLGDGLFVSQDVDMYQFQARAGLVFTATTSVPPGGTAVNTILILFDSAGNFVGQGYPQGDGTSLLQFTVPVTGTYYLGVSSELNPYYDPNTGGSGSPGAHGDYRLVMNLERLRVNVGGGGPPVQQVTGHASWHQAIYLPSGQHYIYQVTINAWLDASGTAHGTMTWTSTQGGRPSSFTLRVDTLVIIGNTVHVEGIIVRAGRNPGDVNTRVAWDLVDNGTTGDVLNGALVDGGNFSIH
jgi:hypothetical protein